MLKLLDQEKYNKAIFNSKNLQNKMTVDEWIKDKYKEEFFDVTDDFLNQSPIKSINNLDDLIVYLDWNYRNTTEYSVNCTLACEMINYKNYQNK